jgi:hypothetical protein
MSRSQQKIQALAARAIYEAFANGFTADLFGVIEAEGLRAEVRVFRVKTLSECERDLLQLLSGQRGPRTTNEILSDLDQAGMIHGEGTVKRALAELRKRKLLELNGSSGFLITATGEQILAVAN